MISALDTSQYIPDYDHYPNKKIQKKEHSITHASKLNNTGIMEPMKLKSSEQAVYSLPLIYR